MRFGTVQPVKEDGKVDATAQPIGAVEVSKTAVAAGVGSAGLLAGIIAAIVPAVTDVGKNAVTQVLPAAAEQRALCRRVLQVGLLQQALNPASVEDRQHSVRILLAAGLLDDPSGKIGLAADSGHLPQWQNARPFSVPACAVAAGAAQQPAAEEGKTGNGKPKAGKTNEAKK